MARMLEAVASVRRARAASAALPRPCRRRPRQMAPMLLREFCYRSPPLVAEGSFPSSLVVGDGGDGIGHEPRDSLAVGVPLTLIPLGGVAIGVRRDRRG
jgi:hypothetical protein